MSDSRPAAFIILAAGEGTRMKSKKPKLLHAFGGRSILGHVLAAAREQRPGRLIVVVGHARDQVGAHARQVAPEAILVTQESQSGTGHAVRSVVEAVGSVPGTVVVANGDNPLITTETCADLVNGHEAAGNAVTVLTARVPRPQGYGRIRRDEAGAFTGIVEDADASEPERAINEINSGWYAFDWSLLADAVKRVPTDNAQGQEYITDVVEILRLDGHQVGTVPARDAAEIEGVNDRAFLARARRTFNDRVLDHWMRSGVTIFDPATTWIDVGVTIGQDTEIGPGTQLVGSTVIGRDVVIGPHTQLTDTTVGDGAAITHAVCVSAQIGANATVGPYAYLRPGTRIGDNAHIGTYVELKNSVVGTGSKVPHLSYVGDAEIGEESNIGAATIFANYDGQAKHPTVVGDHVRVGSDTVLVAPVRVGDGAYTGSGSVITEDVPPGALGIARGKQHNSDGWVERKRPGTRAAEAAARSRSVKTKGQDERHDGA